MTCSANISHDSLQTPQDLLSRPTCKVAQVATMEAMAAKGMLINHDLDSATSANRGSQCWAPMWPHFLRRPAKSSGNK